MDGHCSTGQSPQWAVVQMEEEEEEEEETTTTTTTTTTGQLCLASKTKSLLTAELRRVVQFFNKLHFEIY